MERVEKTVFLSYRRTNPWAALAIFQGLTQYGYDVFFDFSGIASGDFEKVIIENIRAQAHFLVLLTPSALVLEGFDFGLPAIAKTVNGEAGGPETLQRVEDTFRLFLGGDGAAADPVFECTVERCAAFGIGEGEAGGG